jgi:hypothetical protein
MTRPRQKRRYERLADMPRRFAKSHTPEETPRASPHPMKAWLSGRYGTNWKCRCKTYVSQRLAIILKPATS